MYVCFAYMYVCAPCLCLVPVEVRGANESLGTGVTNIREFWEWNPGSLQVQPMLLASETSLQPLNLF